MQQLREALKILAERVLILEHMIGVHGEEKLDYAKKGLLTFGQKIPLLSRRELNYLHSEMCSWKQINTHISHAASCPGGGGMLERASDHHTATLSMFRTRQQIPCGRGQTDGALTSLCQPSCDVALKPPNPKQILHSVSELLCERVGTTWAARSQVLISGQNRNDMSVLWVCLTENTETCKSFCANRSPQKLHIGH